MAEDIFFYRDGDRRAVATNASNADDFEWSASLEIAIMIADLNTAEERNSEMAAWAPLLREISVLLTRSGVRSSREIIRAGCPSLTAEHLLRGGGVQ